jgi:L-amino acid N-acyltransferase YncA
MMPSSAKTIRIRPVTVGDAPAIAAIYAHHVDHGTATFDTVALSAPETRAKIEAILSKKASFLVAEREGRIIGYAYATPFRDRPAYAATCENSIYLDHTCVGQGVGSALLAALLEVAEAIGFRQMIAVIGGGEPASVALHTRAGFRHTGRMISVGRKFGRWLDTIYLQKALGAGDSSAPEGES